MKLPVWVTRNWRLKVGCALLAFVTWMGVVYAGNPPETRSVTVHIPQEAASIPAGFVLVRKVPDVVIRLGGSRSSLDGFNTSTLTVLVNWKAVTHQRYSALFQPVMTTPNFYWPLE